jgi:DNA-binding Lrp family transcriptional regulator
MQKNKLLAIILSAVIIFSLASFVIAKAEQSQKGQTNAQQHRSEVANFVQGLLHIAEREPAGIGEQVRVIAQEQNKSASTTIQAMEKIQNRNKIRTFLFGSDYRNLGALRSEMVQTRNRLRQLNQLMEQTENEESKLELQNQIQEMEQEQLRIENFIREQEGKFSLFGWLLKFVSGYKNLPR